MDGGGQSGPNDDRGERRGDRAQPARQPADQPGPQQDDGDRHGPDQGRAAVAVDDPAGQGHDVVDGVGVGRTAEDDVQLADGDGEPNPAEHAVHDRGRHGEGCAGDPTDAEDDLEHTGGRGHRARDPPPVGRDEPRDDHGEPGRGPTDLQADTAERPRHDPTDHSGDETGGDRRARGDRDTQRQRHRDQKHHQRRLHVRPQVRPQGHVNLLGIESAPDGMSRWRSPSDGSRKPTTLPVTRAARWAPLPASDRRSDG